MIERFLQLRLFSPSADHRIFAWIFPDRHGFMRQVWNPKKHLSLLVIECRCLFVEPSNFISDLPHARLDIVSRFAFRALPADLFAQPFSIRIALLERRLRLAPLRVDPQDLIDLRRLVAPARGQPAFYKVGLFADEPNIEHGRIMNAQDRMSNAERRLLSSSFVIRHSSLPRPAVRRYSARGSI